MKQPSDAHASWTLYVDGAARNNPGPAGAGVYLKKDNETVCREGFYLGIKTNNQAEYLALLLGLYFIHQFGKPQDRVAIASDSLLLVKQLLGEYRIKNSVLIPLNTLAKKLLLPFKVDIYHVVREDNTEADRLANKGIDAKRSIPASFIELLHQHEIGIDF